MSTAWANQTKLDDAHAERREAANLSQLFGAHDSPAFARLAAHWAGVIDLEGQSSLDSCEHPSRHPETDQPSGDYPETAADLEVVTDATMAIRAGLSRSRERQRKILGMIDVDEVGHAKRFARCQRQSAQLECGECGYDGNYVPITCDSRLCPVCMNRRMGSTMDEYGELVEGMKSATFATYTVENVSEVETRVDTLQGAFRRLRQRTIPACGEVTREIDGELRTIRAAGVGKT
jgi:rubrerythrin